MLEDIVVKDEQVLLVSSSLQTLCFNDNFHAFKVVLKLCKVIELCLVCGSILSAIATLSRLLYQC